MKPRLTVLLAAGSTMNVGSQTAHGMPSTGELTNLVAKLKLPYGMVRGVPHVVAENQGKPFAIDFPTPIIPLIQSALKSQNENVDFELMLYALEQLEPLVTAMTRHGFMQSYQPVLAAFVELIGRYELLRDPLVLSEARNAIIISIVEEIERRKSMAGTSDSSRPLRTLVESLESRFRLSVFTLNYDDLIDKSRQDWFDGFTESSQSPTGHMERYFDAKSFINWQNESIPLLAHMHGSVRFGYSRMRRMGIVKHDSTAWALRSIKDTSVGETVQGGQQVSGAPIISGLNKVTKLSLNPCPYGFYYHAFIDALLTTPSLLIVGYGARDPHINTWLSQYASIHGDARRIVWLTRRTGTDVGRKQPDAGLFPMLSGWKWEDALAYADDGQQVFQRYGPLGFVPSGFPADVSIVNKMTDFLFG